MVVKGMPLSCVFWFGLLTNFTLHSVKKKKKRNKEIMNTKFVKVPQCHDSTLMGEKLCTRHIV